MTKPLPKLIYFRGCPNAQITQTRLEQAGIEFEKICQDELPDNSPYRRYSSPTLLLDDEIVFGTGTGNDGGCSLDLPAVTELKARLKKLRRK